MKEVRVLLQFTLQKSYWFIEHRRIRFQECVGLLAVFASHPVFLFGVYFSNGGFDWNHLASRL